MAYTTTALVKAHLEIAVSTHDAIFDALILQVQSVIDFMTGDTWEAGADTTRTFNVERDVEGMKLFFGRWCAAIGTITNNADGTPEVISAGEYVKIPPNGSKSIGVKLLSSSGKTWRFTDDPETGITVSGDWARTQTAPAWVSLAALRLTAFWYRKRSSQEFDVIGIPPNSVITIPQAIPRDVAELLENAQTWL